MPVLNATLIAPYILLLLPTLLIPAAFLLPLLWRRHGLVLSIHVTPEYLSSPGCRGLIRQYVTTVALIALAGVALVVASLTRHLNALVIAGPTFEIIALLILWARTWRMVLPHRQTVTITRTASLAPLPGLGASWWTSTLAALLPLAAAAIVLVMHWYEIPARFPTHWGADGVANGFSTRSPLAVFWPLAAAAFIVLWMATLAPLTARYSPSIVTQPALFRMTRNILRSAAWLISLLFAATSLLPLAPNPARFFPMGIAALVVTFFAMLIYVVVQAYRHPELTHAVDVTDPARWKAGLIYFNPSDAALLVPKRSGLGYTFNLARPLAWVFVFAILIVALLPLLFIHQH
jgi:uncharacterized membrane protein